MTVEAVMHPWVTEGAARVRFGINTIALPDWSATRAFVQEAEELGYDAVMLPDHPLTTPSATWTVLAALAEATHRIRLGTMVSCIHYLNPAILARLAADVDRISDGRVVLGLGSGDQPWEYQQLGLDFPPVGQRQAALEAGLRIIGPLLRGDSVQLHPAAGASGDTRLQLPAVQQPHVPLLIAGGGERTTLRFAAQYADATNLGAASWAGHVFTSGDATHKLDVLRQHCAQLGRPYTAVLRTALIGLFLADTPAAARAKADHMPPELAGFFEHLFAIGTAEDAAVRISALVDAGFQYVFCIILPFDPETLRLTAERVMPAVAHASLRSGVAGRH